jgi:hypothetical protein
VSPRRCSLTLWLGLLGIIACEALLFTDVAMTGRGPVKSDEQILQLPPPNGIVAAAARFVAGNMTPLAWFEYIIFLDGLLSLQLSGSPIRERPHHFAMLSLASIFIWCVFDVFNFYSIKAWNYVGMPRDDLGRLVGYFIAFGSIVPGHAHERADAPELRPV